MCHAIPISKWGSPWSPYAYGVWTESLYAYRDYVYCNPCMQTVSCVIPVKHMGMMFYDVRMCTQKVLVQRVTQGKIAGMSKSGNRMQTRTHHMHTRRKAKALHMGTPRMHNKTVHIWKFTYVPSLLPLMLCISSMTITTGKHQAWQSVHTSCLRLANKH